MKSMLVIFAMLLLAGCASRPAFPEGALSDSTATAPASSGRTPPNFKPIGNSGAQEAMLHVQPLPTIGGRLEIRIIGVGQGTQLVVPTDHEVALEVRTGNAIVTTDGVREEHAAGDIWVVPMNAQVLIEPSNETTVLRAMYYIKE
jgi:hypothetical protein